MADGIGAAASVVGLVGAAFAIIQEVRKARAKVRGTSKTLDNISSQLVALEGSLRLIKEEEGLQTAGVEQQVKAVLEIATELKSFFDKVAALQQRRAVPQFIHMLKSGDADDEILRGIHDRLDRAKQDLGLRISVAQVGVLGNVRDGFRVAFDILTETNERVKEVLGTNLALIDLVRGRPVQGIDGTIALSTADIEVLQTSGPQISNIADTHDGETSIYENVTLGQARIMTGDVGVEVWQAAAGRKTTIARNRFGDNVRIMTGNQGGDAAVRFNENFWN